jgi:hypothetical protein
MKTILSCVTFIFMLIMAARAQQNPVHLMGSVNTDYLHDIETGTDGSIVVSGRSLGGILLTNGDTLQTEGFIAKYDSSGNQLWIMAAGDCNMAQTDLQHVPVIALDASNNIYVVGYAHDSARLGSIVIADTGDYNVFLAKLDGAGNVIWSKTCTDQAWGNNIAVDHNNHVIIGGYMTGVTDFEGTVLTPFGFYQSADVFIASYDLNGNFNWVKQAGGSGFYGDILQDIAVDAQDNIIITGEYRSNALFDNITLPYHFSNTCCWEGFVAKYDSSGQALWANYSGEHTSSVITDNAGNSYMGGTASFTWVDSVFYGFNPYYGYFISKFNAQGALQWYMRDTITTQQLSHVLDLATDSTGNIYGAGNFRDSIYFAGSWQQASYCYDTSTLVSWFFAIDSSGALIFSNNFKTCGILYPNTSWANAVALNGCKLAYCGHLASSVLYLLNGDSIYSTGGGADGYIIEYDLCNLTSTAQAISLSSGSFVFPNPVSDILTIVNNYPNSENACFRLSDISGREVLVSDHLQKYNTVSLAHLNAGLYSYIINAGNKGQSRGKLLIIK